MSNASQTNHDREPRLLDAFVQMADTLVDDYDVAELLHGLVTRCVELLGAAAAGILMADQRDGLHVLASSSEESGALERFQIEAREGPCWDCVRSGQRIFSDDLATDPNRWPIFGPRMLREGFTTVHAFPMRLRQETVGALNLFGREPTGLPDRDIRVAQTLADIATIGILQERAIHRAGVLTGQLQSALVNRVAIEQAKGMLAQAGNLDMNRAFQALRGYGRRRSTRLSEVAQQLIDGVLTPEVILTEQPPEGS
ncbi:GAF and ANTAR domain-containing protein [Nocardia sp. NPDC058058]|uniref:GAF and ANTAR domain-containing protein n=1 Tax=Nocardia sp. NPDC058058 TaxID=3346317 RepID=UPI0036DAC3FA